LAALRRLTYSQVSRHTPPSATVITPAIPGLSGTQRARPRAWPGRGVPGLFRLVPSWCGVPLGALPPGSQVRVPTCGRLRGVGRLRDRRARSRGRRPGAVGDVTHSSRTRRHGRPAVDRRAR